MRMFSHGKIIGQCHTQGCLLYIAPYHIQVALQFGWDRNPSPESVVSHFANVVSSYDPRDKVLFMEIARSVYSELWNHDHDTVSELLSRHEILTDWIWHGDGFTRPGRMVVAAPFTDLRPYVYALPTEMSIFAEFFGGFGVQTSCDVLDVLATIRDKYSGAGAADEPPAKATQRRRRFLESEVM